MLSFRARLALGHLVAIVLVFALIALGAYWALSRAVHGQLDAALVALAETEKAMLEQSDDPVGVHETAPGPAPPSYMRLDRLVQIIDADGHVVSRSSNLGGSRLPVSAELLQRLGRDDVIFETRTDFGEEPTRLVSVPVHARGKLWAIQVAGSLDDTNHVMQSATLLFIATGLALMVAVVGVGQLLTRRILRAMDGVVHEALRIGQSNLNTRLPHPGTNDEMGRLVDALNDMLARLERAFETQQRFTADASHELRSPLSRMRMELEVTLRRPREADDYVAAMRSCLEEVERLVLVLEELLALARLDAGQGRAPSDVVSVNALVGETVQRVEPLARERGMRVVVEPAEPITAKVAHIAAGLVLANLLDNALKFSPAGSTISIGIVAEGADAIVSVRDEGPGIAPSDMPHVFERFFRAAQTRSEATPGVGLGLSLSQAIIHAHGGRITAANRAAGGAEFALHLPR